MHICTLENAKILEDYELRQIAQMTTNYVVVMTPSKSSDRLVAITLSH